MRSLEKLDVSHNKLESLPEDMVELPALKELNCSHNKLATLPESLGLVKTLKVRSNNWIG